MSSWVQRFNPFGQLGALAVTSVLIAVASGVALLPFYSTSVHEAHSSVQHMLGSLAWSAGLIHSVHRYSSDAAMLLTVLHLLRILETRAFLGGRHLSYQTGVISIGLLWFIGWTGYWLIWDQTAYRVAELSARLLDSLPIFGTFLGRGLLMNDSINNQVFFVVFFIHMIVPLGLFLGLWIHVSRVARPQFLVDRRYALAFTALLIILSAIFPGRINEQANSLVIQRQLFGDVFYTLPIWIFESASPLGTWAGLLGAYAVVALVPWGYQRFVLRGPLPAPSVVDPNRCTGCENCFTDCPYGAIEMVPRPRPEEGAAKWPPGARESIALVNAERCMSCGICNGSCDSNGNNLPWLTTDEVEERVSAWGQDRERKWLLFACREVLGGFVRVLPHEGLHPGLPGFRLVEVPCAGHVNPKTVKKALELGFEGVFIASSLPGACVYREGNQWTEERMSGRRKPFGRLGNADRRRIRVAAYRTGDTRSLFADAQAFASGGIPSPKSGGNE